MASAPLASFSVVRCGADGFHTARQVSLAVVLTSPRRVGHSSSCRVTLLVNKQECVLTMQFGGRPTSFRRSFHILMKPSLEAVTNTQWSVILKLSTAFTLRKESDTPQHLRCCFGLKRFNPITISIRCCRRETFKTCTIVALEDQSCPTKVLALFPQVDAACVSYIITV